MKIFARAKARLQSGASFPALATALPAFPVNTRSINAMLANFAGMF